ncbi:ABC transporter ATP-binding protein [Alteromonadaceae bacterium M269]|nr:ABC transporter ATP-binding protein [Alteromonadaceae bacterium M269]
MNSYCIETTQLTKKFGNKTAINSLDLKIKQGGIHAIVGSNGAGKSTLFRILLGVATPTDGEASIFGVNCQKLTEKERVRFGYVNEEHTLPTWMKVSALVNMQKHFYPKWSQETYNSVIGYFDVDPNQKIAGLSRGERAGLNLSMALAQNPDVLILDEPTLGLDVVAKQSFLEALMFTETQNESTIIYCSHQMEEIERVADNLIMLEKGRLTNNSSPDEFVARVSSWIAEFPNKPSQLTQSSKVLSCKKIDDLHHIVTIDEDANFQEFLQNAGGSNIRQVDINLPNAVNAFLTKNHNTPDVFVQ